MDVGPTQVARNSLVTSVKLPDARNASALGRPGVLTHRAAPP